MARVVVGTSGGPSFARSGASVSAISPLTRRPLRLKRIAIVAAATYAVQVAIVVYAVFSPVVEAEDDDWNYTVSRVSGMRDFIPLVGLVHHVTGEPVWLRRTNKQTGEVVVRGYDLVSDIQDEYPLMRGAPYSKRLLDSPR